MSDNANENYDRLIGFFKDFNSVVVAFSGGVDSSVLASIAFQALGEKALAVTLVSPTSDPSELESADSIASLIGLNHIKYDHSELIDDDFKSNPFDRCYYCKKMLASKIIKIASEKGFDTVVEGTNASELKGHRPGFKALKELGVVSPFAELGIDKDDVRSIAKFMGLPNYDKPSTACLSSRIPYGTKISGEILEMIALSESFIRDLGVDQVRVRVLDDVAVVEVLPESFSLIVDNGVEISKKLNQLGFKRITLDLAGYRTGSMND